MGYRSIARQFLQENYPYHFQLWKGYKTGSEAMFAVFGHDMNTLADINSIAVGNTKEELKQNILHETYDFPITEEEYDTKIRVVKYNRVMKDGFIQIYYIGLYGTGDAIYGEEYGTFGCCSLPKTQIQPEHKTTQPREFKGSGIYYIKNKLNGKLYIGQSQNIKKRTDRFFEINRNYGSTKITQARNKYGVENFEIGILKHCTNEELNYWEKFYILRLNTTYPNGYNQSLQPYVRTTVNQTKWTKLY